MIKAWMGVDIRGPVECTKILMKILHPDSKTGLGSALKMILKINISKSIDFSKWGTDTLSKRQKEYIANDTLYLYPLMIELKRSARFGSLFRYRDAIEAMRKKAILDVEGLTDLLVYEQDPDTNIKRQWWATRPISEPIQHLYCRGE